MAVRESVDIQKFFTDSVNQQLHIFYRIQKSHNEIWSDWELHMRAIRMVLFSKFFAVKIQQAL